MAVGTEVYKESDGNAVAVMLTATVESFQVAVVDSWLGITMREGDSGDAVALDIADVEWQIEVPAALNVSKGDRLYIDTNEITGHTPNDAAYVTSSSATTILFGIVTADKDANNVVTVRRVLA